MTKHSQRFQPSYWMKWLVPTVLVLILLGAITSPVIVILSVIGITPA